MVFPGRAEGPQLDLPEHWLSSEAKNLIERMVVKAPSWDRENSHFSSLGVFFSLSDSVFSLLKPRATTRSWKIRIPARDWVVVIFMNWRRMLGSVNQKSQDFCTTKHLEATQNTERGMPNCSLVLGISPIDVHVDFGLPREEHPFFGITFAGQKHPSKRCGNSEIWQDDRRWCNENQWISMNWWRKSTTKNAEQSWLMTWKGAQSRSAPVRTLEAEISRNPILHLEKLRKSPGEETVWISVESV